MLHLLLVEDNRADVFLVREALRQSDITADLTVAVDGEEAANLLDERRLNPDFVILDLNVPKLSGLTILEQHNPKDGPPIVVLSGSESTEDRQLALAKGAKDYVVKPAGFEPFLEVVQEIVQRWGSALK